MLLCRGGLGFAFIFPKPEMSKVVICLSLFRTAPFVAWAKADNAGIWWTSCTTVKSYLENQTPQIHIFHSSQDSGWVWLRSDSSGWRVLLSHCHCAWLPAAPSAETAWLAQTLFYGRWARFASFALRGGTSRCWLLLYLCWELLAGSQ